MDKDYKTKPTYTRRNINMKRARIINAITWVAIAITLCVWVSKEWSNNGCPVSSLILASAVYTTFCAAIGVVIDLTMQGK